MSALIYPFPTVPEGAPTGITILPPIPDHANIGREGWRISSSQMEDFSGCQRLWAWKKIQGLPGGDNASAALGNRVHTILEKYLLTGALPDQSTLEGQIATSGLHLLPQPMAEGLEVEKTWTFASPEGNHYTGRKDYAYVDLDGVHVIGDHKTTSDFKWAQTAETLGKNIQAITYAAEAMLHYQVDRIGLEWTYYRTKGSRAAKQVRIYLDAEEVEKQFISIDSIAYSIHDVRKRIRPGMILDLPANVDRCEKYGGCPFRSRCNMTPAQRTQAIMNAGSLDLLAKLQQKAAAEGTPAPAPEPSLLSRLAGMSPPAAPVAPTGFPPPLVQAPMSPSAALAAPMALPFPPSAPPPAVAPATMAPPTLAAPVSAAGIPLANIPAAIAPPTPAAGTWYAGADGLPVYPCHCHHQCTVSEVQASGGRCPNCNREVAGAAIFAQVNPPESALPVSAPVNPAAVAAAQAGPALAFQLPTPPATPSGIPGGLPPTAAALQPTAPAATVAGRKGRPPGAKNKPKAGAEAPTPAATPGQGGIGILYVNCMPQGGCDTADTFLFAPARKRFAETFPQTPDYRMMEYGKGTGLFAALVAEYLANHDVGDIFLDTRSSDAQVCMSALVAAADSIVRGVQ